MREVAYRFLVGGLVVSIFAVLANLLKPKSFAGLFGAAPSVALATLGLTVLSLNRTYASIEARSMTLGATGLLLYACVVARLMMHTKWHTSKASFAALIIWFLVTFSLWSAFLT